MPNFNPQLFHRVWVRTICWVLFVTAVGVLAGMTATGRHIPGDLTAYLAAADVFASGGNPYGSALEQSEYWAGYPYVYPPATLYLLRPLLWASRAVIATFHVVVSTGLLLFSLWRLRRRYELDLPLGVLLVAATLFGPVTADILAGNLGLVMLAATVAAADLSDRAPAPHRMLGLALLGVLLSFKVFWLAPPVLMLSLGGRWRQLVSLSSGVAAVFVASAAMEPGLADWLSRLQWVRTHFSDSMDLLSLAPVLYPFAVAGALTLVWKLRDSPVDLLYAAGCCSVVAWPRLAPYSFVVLIPAIFELTRRQPPTKVLPVVVPMWGPLYWFFALPSGTITARWLHFLWACAVAVFLTYSLRRSSD